MRLTELLNKNTVKVEAPPNPEVKTEPTVSNNTSTPNKPNVAESTDNDKQYEAVGEANTALFAFSVEAPLQAWNGIYNKLRLRKARKTIKDPKELEAEIKRITDTKDANSDIIPLEKDEYDHLKNAFTAIAKQKKSTESSPSLLIGGAILAILLRRVEILVD